MLREISIITLILFTTFMVGCGTNKAQIMKKEQPLTKNDMQDIEAKSAIVETGVYYNIKMYDRIDYSKYESLNKKDSDGLDLYAKIGKDDNYDRVAVSVDESGNILSITLTKLFTNKLEVENFYRNTVDVLHDKYLTFNYSTPEFSQVDFFTKEDYIKWKSDKSYSKVFQYSVSEILSSISISKISTSSNAFLYGINFKSIKAEEFASNYKKFQKRKIKEQLLQ